ncbi:MAG: apolipoprotein N-acyltransferase [Acidobacteria bacterium]|nr:apolipoprotein N-acyltransferase [Acidobacteriota bacterium]
MKPTARSEKEVRPQNTSLLLAALSGLLQVLIFPRFGITPLALVAVAPLLIACAREDSARARFVVGWLAGAIYWAGVCYWIYDVMHSYAGLSAVGAGAIFAAFFLAKGLYLAVFSIVAGPLMRQTWAIPAVAATWVSFEGLHQYLAFTWLQLGNAGIDLPLLPRLAPFTGIYGPSVALALINVALAVLIVRRGFRELVWLSPLVLLFFLPTPPAAFPAAETARLVQPNIHPDELREGRWNYTRHAQHLERMAYLSEGADAAPPALVIWPEYPVPAYYSDDEKFREYMSQLAIQVGAPIIFNSIERGGPGGRQPLNSALVVNEHGELLSQYSKMFLVPFGEFVPWPFSHFIDKITLEAGNFFPGAEVVVTEAGGHRIGTFICYESVFLRGVREFVYRGAEVLVNISNDSWYGRSAARHQHLLIARMRALENSRWLLRATNDGITSVIDPAGRVSASLPSFEQNVMSARFGYRGELTWFTRFGQWFLTLCAAASLAAILVSRRLGYLEKREK